MKRFVMTALAAASVAALAQPTSPQTIVVTGNPLRTSDGALPATVLTGTDLVLRRASSLGETLDGLPGVSASYFGPNANRPIIRGQDGDRIRLLSNAGASLDASSLSFDHAVPIEPLLVERIEVLRGPAALMYGGSAIGGVVNAIDNRIPKTRLAGVSGAAEFRLGGAASERAATAFVEAGSGSWALHADAFGRRTDDLRVPTFNRPLADGGTQRSTRVLNSASEASGGAVGTSWLGRDTTVGVSLDSYRNDYGIVAEDDITIRMRRDKLALSGEWRLPGSFFSVLRAQAAGTDYQHQEIERDGAVGTTFKTRGGDARFEAVHQALSLGSGKLEGTLGAQFETVDFSALGEEAFVPTTRTRQQALFAVERWSFGTVGHVSLGVRQESVTVRSDGDADPTADQFGAPQERSFSPRSAAVSGAWNLSPAWQLAANLASTQRAPTSYELYANGVHAATGAYERGDPSQRLERGRHLDVSLAWRGEQGAVKLQLFDARFSNYIVLAATGEPDFVDEDGNTAPVFAFTGSRARLRGMELEGSWQVLTGARRLNADVKLDTVRGTNLDTSEPLPRLPPLRVTAGLSLFEGPWTARLEVQHATAQDRVANTDTATDGWTLVNASASRAFKLGAWDALLFAKLNNLGNVLAYSATTTSTLRPLSPLPGRSAMMGLRVNL